MSNLYNKYNPKNFNDVIGQPMAIKVLKAIAKKQDTPNGILLTHVFKIHG